ncbi:MAG: T9SS type A sorting domain-containing protein, partial [Calditrichaeota bacterium]|nr:T9SS type A sorting domain-containing protein [Calditrichota bacterium]
MRHFLLLLKCKAISFFRTDFTKSVERNYSCPARLIALVGYLCFVMLIPSELFGQTEIAGEVTGEWTSEGSPYTVVDSTWIPEGGELIIQGDVEVIFQENQGLHIFGHFEVRGVQFETPVWFNLIEVEHWKGLRFYGEREATFEGLEIDCPDTLFFLDNNCRLEFRNCDLIADKQAIWSHQNPNWTNRGWNLGFYHSSLRGGGRLIMVGSLLIAEDSKFNIVGYHPGDQPGFQGEMNYYEFINCEIHGGIRGAHTSIVEDCEILGHGGNWESGVVITGPEGRMLRTSVSGRVSLGGDFDHYTPFDDNVVTGRMTITGLNTNINRCELGTQVDIRNARANIRNCILPGHFSVSESDVTIDSCQFVNQSNQREVLGLGDGTRATITRSVLVLDYSHFDASIANVTANFDHNTIYFKMPYAFSVLIYGADVSFTNNIFLTTEDVGALFRSDSAFTFEYNSVWGFDNFREGRMQEMFEQPPNNIEADPLLEWYGRSPLLTADSPCIDAGYPDSPLDRDGTRSDIGAYAFNQPNFISRNDPGMYYSDTPVLIQAYPNPFNSSLNISFTMENTNHISIKLYDLAGREVL